MVGALRTLFNDVRKWTWHHVVVFFITFILYAVFHAERKAFSNVKDLMGKTLSPVNASMYGNASMYPHDLWEKEHMFASNTDANVFFGELDLLFLFAYAIGLYISGFIGDRVNLRYMLATGIGGSAILTFLFGYLWVPYKIHNKMYFRALFFLNGLFQSTGWPASVAIMGHWFAKSSSGLVFGLWSSNSNLGNVIGSLLVTAVIDYGFEYGMLLNAIVALCCALLVFCCLLPHPNDAGIESGDDEQSPTEDHVESIEIPTSPTKGRPDTTEVEIVANGATSSGGHGSTEAISFWEALMIPGVLCYSFAFACLKMVTYAFFFWLPLYLTQHVHWPPKLSDQLSNFYDIGGVLGSIFSGMFSDFIGLRSPVVSVMLLCAILCLYLYDLFGDIYVANVVLMVFSGVMLAGPASLICGVISADLGKHDKIQGSKQALATVSGIIDGTGSLGAALGQYIVGIISKYWGWAWVFKFLMIMICLSFLLISPIVYVEMREWRNKRNAVVRKNEAISQVAN